MVVEPAGRHGGQGEPAEVDLIQASAGLEMLLPAAGHVIEPAPLADECRSALAAEGLVLVARKKGPGPVEARALDDAPYLLPGEGGVGAPELSLVPPRELRVVHDQAQRGAAVLTDQRPVQLLDGQELGPSRRDLPSAGDQVVEQTAGMVPQPGAVGEVERANAFGRAQRRRQPMDGDRGLSAPRAAG